MKSFVPTYPSFHFCCLSHHYKLQGISLQTTSGYAAMLFCAISHSITDVVGYLSLAKFVGALLFDLSVGWQKENACRKKID
jgi:hypothetical protein